MRYTLVFQNPSFNVACSDYRASKAQIVKRSNRSYNVGNICPKPVQAKPIKVIFEDGAEWSVQDGAEIDPCPICDTPMLGDEAPDMYCKQYFKQ